MWTINGNDIVDFDGKRWLVTRVWPQNGEMKLVRFDDEGMEYSHAHQNDVSYVRHRPMNVPTMAKMIGKGEPEKAVKRGDVIRCRNLRSDELEEYVVTHVSPSGGCDAVSRDGRKNIGFARFTGFDVIGHEEVEPQGGRFRTDIVFDAVPDDERHDVAARFLSFLGDIRSCLFFAGLSIDGRVYSWEDISAFNREHNRRSRLSVDDPEAIFILVEEAARDSVVRVAYSDSVDGMVVEIRPDELAYYVETSDFQAFADTFETMVEEYDSLLCQDYRDDDEWEDDECDPVFRIGEWVTVETSTNAKIGWELDSHEDESVRSQQARLGDVLDDQEVREIGYDRIAVFKCERWFIDSVSEDGMASLHRIERSGDVKRIDIQKSQIRRPNDALSVKSYLEASASTFCGDTCPDCGAKIRMKDVTWKKVKVAPVDEACEIEHQDRGETSWKWTCQDCGHKGSIVESYPLCGLSRPFELGDTVCVDGKEYVVVGGDAAKGTYNIQETNPESGGRRDCRTGIRLGADNWLER